MSTISGGASAPSNAISDPIRPSGADVPIEPVGSPATPKPFSPGAGTWIGAGVAALFGGAIAGSIGIAGLAPAVEGASRLRTGLGIAGGIGIGLLTAGGAAWGAYAISRGSYNSSERERVTAQFGTSTLQNAREFMTPFDHDDDGSIDLVNRTGLPGQDEQVFLESRDQSESHLKYDWWDDDWDVDTDHYTESRGVSAVDVWEAANTAPKDDTVTDVELAHLMANFDTDRNGALNASEKDAFTAAHPVIMDDWRR
jgi:hypothetical protein